MSKSGTKKEAITKIQRTSILIFFVILSFFLGRYSYYLESGSLSADLMLQPGKTYQQGYNEAVNNVKNQLRSTGLFPDSVMSIGNAVIKSVNDQDIVVEINASEIDIFKEGVLDITVKVPESVNVYEYKMITQEEIEKNTELKIQFDKLKERQDAGEDVTIEAKQLLESTLLNQVKLSDLKPGDILSIESKTDIRKSDTIEAVSIQLLSQ